MKLISKYIYVSCPCGEHLIDLMAEDWNDTKTGFYNCNKCGQPLICRGDDGHFYRIGERVM
jgi:predicted SprT family Zn-dependent metalloprotease